MVIMGYLYRCLPEILRFVSFATSNDCDFKNLFIDLKKEKEKLKKLGREHLALTFLSNWPTAF